jgi:hypothetical protein
MLVTPKTFEPIRRRFRNEIAVAISFKRESGQITKQITNELASRQVSSIKSGRRSLHFVVKRLVFKRPRGQQQKMPQGAL